MSLFIGNEQTKRKSIIKYDTNGGHILKKRETNKTNIIGKKLREFRIDKSYSYEDLITQLELKGVIIHKSALYNIEHNKRSVRDFELLAFMNIFNKNFEDFLDNIK